MKTSIYNSYIKITEQSILVYNALENNYLITNIDYANNIQNNNFNLLPDDFLNILRDKRFLIPNALNEASVLLLERMKKYGDETHFNLILNPTLNCNLNCWYCYETKGREVIPNVIIENIKNLIFNLLQNKTIKTFDISFFWGEPLLLEFILNS